VRSIFAVLVAVLSLTLSFPAYGNVTDEGTGLAYGKDHIYMLKAPPGWVLDTKSGSGQGIFAAFYPKGSSWNSSVVMYSNAAGREGRTPEAAMAEDEKAIRAKSPHLHVVDGGTIITADRKKALIRYFSGDNFGSYEAIGYVIERNIVANIVLTARNKSAFEGGLLPFRQLVSSYRFMTDNSSPESVHAVFKKVGDPPKPTDGVVMTKIVVRPLGMPAAGTQVIWRSGISFLRFELIPKPDAPSRILSVINEPNIWALNNDTHIAQHMKDTGPVFGARMSIFADQVTSQRSEVNDLEYCNELQFFKRYCISPEAGPLLAGQSTDKYKCVVDGATLELLTRKNSQIPLRVSFAKGEKSLALEYVSFQPGLPFDKKLFELPAGYNVVHNSREVHGQ
jgi:hypothetical protein